MILISHHYNLGEDPVELGIETGMTVKVSGTKDIYSGTYEIINAKATIVDTNKTEVAAVDYTDLYTNAEDLKVTQALQVTTIFSTMLKTRHSLRDSVNGTRRATSPHRSFTELTHQVFSQLIRV